MNAKKIWAILKATGKEFSEDKVLRLSAALAYYAMFSIGPLLVIAVGVAGLVFGSSAVSDKMYDQLKDLLGESSANTISSMMKAQPKGSSIMTTIIGIGALLLGAGGVFGQLQDSLNTIWEVKPKPGAGIMGMIRSRFISFSMVLGTGFLLLISLALSTFLSAVTKSVGSKLALTGVLLSGLNIVVSFAVISVLFAMIFKYLPDVRVPFRKIWVGAIGTALLFTIGKYLLGLYLGRASTASPYGAAGSVIIILLWVYYASTILFVGAEFTQVYARATGAKVAPTHYAEPVTQEERAEQGIPHSDDKRRKNEPARPVEHVPSPGDVVRGRPWEVVAILFVAGWVGGFLWRVKHRLAKG